jgi:hypothetical protein
MDARPVLFRCRLCFANRCTRHRRTMYSLAGRYPRAETRTEKAYRSRVAVSGRVYQMRTNAANEPAEEAPSPAHNSKLRIDKLARSPIVFSRVSANFIEDCLGTLKPPRRTAGSRASGERDGRRFARCSRRRSGQCSRHSPESGPGSRKCQSTVVKEHAHETQNVYRSRC